MPSTLPEEIRQRLFPVWKDFPEVRFAYLFGSAARKDAGPLSDVDLAVYLETYRHSLVLELQVALSRALKRDDVDLLILNRTENLILLESILREGILIFERNPEERQEFELETWHLILDFKEQRRYIFGK